MELSFSAPPAWAGCRLDSFLRERGFSSTLRRALKRQPEPCLFLNGRPARGFEPVEAGALVTVRLPAELPCTLPPEPPACPIRYEDDHALALDKPAGMAVHPTLGYAAGTLGNQYAGLLAARGETGAFRPVNRLDAGTSGLVLCARNAWAAPLLAASVQKVYFAVVRGEPRPAAGTIRLPIGRAPGSILLRRVDEAGQPAVTHYETADARGGWALLRLWLETGRTHQIRVHLSHLGHPLAGDWLYGGSRELLGRQALHCASMTFPHLPGGETARAVSPPPADLAALCGALGLSWPNLESTTKGERIWDLP